MKFGAGSSVVYEKTQVTLEVTIKFTMISKTSTLPVAHPTGSAAAGNSDSMDHTYRRRSALAVAATAATAICATVAAGVGSSSWRGTGLVGRRTAQVPDIADAATHSGSHPPPPSVDTGSLIAAQFGPDEHASRDKMEMILQGELSLSGIYYVPGSFASTGEEERSRNSLSPYVKVYGEFCDLDWSPHRDEPTKFPAFVDIMALSRHCGEHRYSLPLDEVVSAVLAYDARPDSAPIKSIPVSGLLLNEGRSGATVVSNALAVAEPASTRVVSEHPALMDALQACDKIRNTHGSDNCDPAKVQSLVRDVVHLLSRTPDPALERMYLKLPSAATAYLGQLREAFPLAPWAFFYREANIALAKATQKKRNACIKQRRSPSEAVRARAFALGLDSLDDLGPQEVCALHLSALVRTAFTEHETSGTGLLVSYDEDLSSNGGRFVPETVLPYLGVGSAANPGTEARGRVDAVLAIDAKARDSGRVWDAAAIKADVGIDLSEEIREASRTFLQTTMFEISRARAL